MFTFFPASNLIHLYIGTINCSTRFSYTIDASLRCNFATIPTYLSFNQFFNQDFPDTLYNCQVRRDVSACRISGEDQKRPRVNESFRLALPSGTATTGSSLFVSLLKNYRTRYGWRTELVRNERKPRRVQ